MTGIEVGFNRVVSSASIGFHRFSEVVNCRRMSFHLRRYSARNHRWLICASTAPGLRCDFLFARARILALTDRRARSAIQVLDMPTWSLPSWVSTRCGSRESPYQLPKCAVFVFAVDSCRPRGVSIEFISFCRPLACLVAMC